MTTTEPAAQAARKVLGPPPVPPPGGAGQRWRSTAQALIREIERGNLTLPLPGQGNTWERWEALRRLACRDLPLARLAEGHSNAQAIMAELGVPASGTAQIWGVWTDRSARYELTARKNGKRWSLTGTKGFCAGARTCTHALVTAGLESGEQGLFVVGNQDTTAFPGRTTSEMASNDILALTFDDVPAVLLCTAEDYAKRPGFHHASAGVAACWYGGARALADTLAVRASAEDCDPYVRAHFGAVERDLCAARAVLRLAAGAVDQDPEDHENLAATRALRTRSVVAEACWSVIRHADEVLGPESGSPDPQHIAAAADLAAYIRQHRGERDLARLGALVARRGRGNRAHRGERDDPAF
ncbi:acyl-CoA dehydrogenase family protein [Nocardiopsis oceani]